MARTQSVDYDEKRNNIMHHAAKLFAEKGFGNTSISEIAMTCGVSKATIYHYYSSKEEILFKIMREHVDDLLDIAKGVESQELGPANSIRSLTRLFLKSYSHAKNKQRALLYELGSLPKKEKAEIISKQRQLIEIVESFLPQSSHASGKLTRAKTMLYFGMMNWTPNWFNPSGALTSDELADLASRIILEDQPSG